MTGVPGSNTVIPLNSIVVIVDMSPDVWSQKRIEEGWVVGKSAYVTEVGSEGRHKVKTIELWSMEFWTGAGDLYDTELTLEEECEQGR